METRIGTVAATDDKAVVVNAENAERQWRRHTSATICDLRGSVVNAENAERQWRRLRVSSARTHSMQVVNAENAERQWRPICDLRGSRNKFAW